MTAIFVTIHHFKGTVGKTALWWLSWLRTGHAGGREFDSSRNNTQGLNKAEEKVLHPQMVKLSGVLENINHRPHLTSTCMFHVSKFPVRC